MRKKSRFYLILLILVSLIPLLAFFSFGLPITHDSEIHVARIASFYQSLTEGNIIPRWAGDLNWGYGTPILMFVYPLPSYLASFFHLFGFSFIDSTKIVFVLGFILSGVFMYLWIRELWGREAGFLAGIFYMFAPYRFVDLYVRGAVGENLAFVWPPLICFLALKLTHQLKWKYVLWGSFCLALLILSHNMLSLMFLPVIFGYMGYLVFISQRRLLLITYYLLLITFAFGGSAFFWFPAVFEAKYTLRDIVTEGNITGFEKFSRLVWSDWNYGGTGRFSVQIGILQWLGIILTPLLIWLFWRKKDRIWVYLLFLFLCFWLAVLFILPVSKIFYQIVPLLSNFQFAWRFLSLAIFPPAIFFGVLIYFMPKKFKFLAVCSLLFAALLLNKNYWKANGFFFYPDSFYTQAYPGTTDTGECSPRWSVRFMEKFPKDHLEIIEGKAKIAELGRTTTRHEYKIEAVTPARVVENTLYFPNWQVFIDGEQTEIQFQDPAWRGLITFNVAAGNHEIVVRFTNTKLRRFADLVSLISLMALFSSLPVLKLTKR